jgi:hypothetical protein
MERIFQILAAILAGVAAYFLWQGNTDRAFIAAVFGAVAFFLSFRFQAGERMKQRAAELEEEELRGEAEEERDEEFDEVSESGAPQLNEIPAQEQVNNGQRTTDNGQI